MIGSGHPDGGDPLESRGSIGPAPLNGSDKTRRLMLASQYYIDLDGDQLVKAEWDKIEEWLKKNIDPKEAP